MFELLKRYAQNAINTVGSAAGNAVNYLEKNAPQVLQDQLNKPLFQQVPFSTPSNIGNFTKEAAQSTARTLPGLELTLNQILAPNKYPDQIPVPQLKNYDLLTGKLPQQLYGSDQTIRSVKGTKDLLQNQYHVPSPVAWGMAVADPALNAVGIGEGVKALGEQAVKQGAKTLFKTGSEDVAKAASQQAAQEVAQQVAKEAPKTTLHPVAQDLIDAQKVVKKTVRNIPATPVKTQKWWSAVKDSVIGNGDIRGAKGVLSQNGPAGKQIVDTIDAADQKASNLAGQAKAKLYQSLQGLNDQEKLTLADVIERKMKPISQAQLNAVNTWRGIAKEIRTIGTQTGMRIGKIENYFPHFIQKDGQVVLDGTTSIGRGANLDFGNLVKSRTGEGAYIKNPDVLSTYIDHAYHNIVKRSYFGEGDKNLYKLASKTDNPKQSASIVDTILGKGNKNNLANVVSQKVTSGQVATKMNFLSPITNMTQQLSVIGRTDIPTAIKTYSNMIKNPEQTLLNAIKAGEVDPQVGAKLVKRLGELGDASIGRKWLELIRFNQAEKMNRIFAVNSGMEYAKKLIDQAKSGSQSAIRELQRLGITDVGKVGEQDLINAGRKLSLETQFSTKPGELPQAWNSAGGRVLTQFKSFSYKQTGFVKKEIGRVASEAMKGNLKPLVSDLVAYGVGAPLIGEISNDIRSIITNKKRNNETMLQRYLSDIVAGSSLGLLDNAGALLGQYGASGVVGAVAGPTISDAFKTVNAVADASKGVQNYNSNKSIGENLDPNNTTKRFAIGSIPGVGKTISNTVVPNSYVDNYIGNNQGLSQADTQTYNNLKALDQSKAEQFKQANQTQNKPKTTMISSFFNKKSFDWNTIPTTKKGLSDYNKQVDTALENGVTNIPDIALKTRFFDGKDYSASDFKTQEDVIKKAYNVLQNDKLTDQQKSAILAVSNIPQSDMEYYTVANMNQRDQLAWGLQKASTFTNKQDLVAWLIGGKKTIAGKSLVNNGTYDILNRLYDQGVISKEERNLVNNVRWDFLANKFYLDRDYKGGSGLFGDSAGGGLSPSKVRSLINKINTALSSSLKKTDINKPKKITPVAAPKITLTRTISAPKKSSSQWFSNY